MEGKIREYTEKKMKECLKSYHINPFMDFYYMIQNQVASLLKIR